MTECWWRGPRLYIRELVECGSGNLIFDQGMIVKYKLNILNVVHAHYGQALPYRLIVVDNNCARELTNDLGPDRPKAVYPVWRYGSNSDELEDLLANPVGEDKDLCFDLTTPVSERPVFGQEHRVVISNLPNMKHQSSRRFLAYLKDVQESYPKAIMHIYGLCTWRNAFGYGLGAADVNPREEASHGRLILPTGHVVHSDKLQAHMKWVTMLGFTQGQMSVPRNRCMYNIKSGEWAAKNYTQLAPVRSTRHKAVDFEAPDTEYQAPPPSPIVPRLTKFQDGDKILCSMCSIQNTCSYFRDGAVCSLPDAESTPLAKYFNTRDSDKIIDGLGTLVAFNARRLERGARVEEMLDDMDPEVTKLAAAVFDQGVKLAKLLNPSLRSSPVKVTVNGNDNRTLVAGSNPQELMGGIIRTLEAQGIPRDQITPQMVKGFLEGMTNPEAKQRALEGQVVEHDG